MNIWQFQQRLSRRLMAWAGVSFVLGLLMSARGKYGRGLGSQFMGWAAVNLGIAFLGNAAARQRNADYENPAAPEIREKETANLRRLLWLNAGLDVFYILGGRWWASRDTGDGERRGQGVGVMIQGAFLLVFDIVHALTLPKGDEHTTYPSR